MARLGSERYGRYGGVGIGVLGFGEVWQVRIGKGWLSVEGCGEAGSVRQTRAKHQTERSTER